ncbi:MAG: hypothetical protein HY692_06510, partial [Cyanobacteria bacterium NC_groundwater_1444_Ag_S-0.65um_54_12]|nr:hypothetical protein [Cyanobacteria bacterium NC_groundwater_1444_Ag_S-0.65um_54_12]
MRLEWDGKATAKAIAPANLTCYAKVGSSGTNPGTADNLLIYADNLAVALALLKQGWRP